jgi:hypothetical protein
MTPYRILPALALLALPACAEDATGCTPTTTTAHQAAKVDLSVTSRSSVVTATLRAKGGRRLSGKRLTFDIVDDGRNVYTDDATTGSDGTAAVDLKRADPDALLAIVRADAFSASFGGDDTYCSSYGRAGFHAVR